ncbi:hypothetical protein DF186_24845, partial [Enterococcus hirae]
VWKWFYELFDELSSSNKVKQMTINVIWFYERFRVFSVNASEETVYIYVCVYIMMLLFTQFFGDKNDN